MEKEVKLFKTRLFSFLGPLTSGLLSKKALVGAFFCFCYNSLNIGAEIMPMTIYGNIPSQIYQFLPLIEKYSNQFNVPVMIIVNTINAESSGNPSAWNPSNGENSRGLMQISEKTALTHPVIGLSLLELPSLFDPETNIFFGTKYLAHIRDTVGPYFKSNTSEQDKWLVYTSSYNQGKNHYIRALQSLTAKGMDHNWSNVLTQVLSQNPRPWEANAKNYGPKILQSLDLSQILIEEPSMFSPFADTNMLSHYSDTLDWWGDVIRKPAPGLILSKEGMKALGLTVVTGMAIILLVQIYSRVRR